MTPEDVAKYKPLLIELLPTDGKAVGNISLIPRFAAKVRERLSVEPKEEDYWEVRNALITEGTIGKGRGKGGSVYLVNALAEKEKEKKREKRPRESDLYGPFFTVIKDTWAKENGIQHFIIQQTAAQ